MNVNELFITVECGMIQINASDRFGMQFHNFNLILNNMYETNSNSGSYSKKFQQECTTPNESHML